jgi:KaiC/GvpD/RAD55 family RecA-like ATPase
MRASQFAGSMETAVNFGAIAIHNALQQSAAVKREIDHDARVYNSVNRLAAAFKAERRKTACLEATLRQERAARKIAEIALWRSQTGR